jgi:hypothetical protein
MLPLVLIGSFDFAQDDGAGRLLRQRVCFPLVLSMRLRRISIRRYPPPLPQESTP